MNKRSLIIAFLVVFIVQGFIGCGGNKEDDSDMLSLSIISIKFNDSPLTDNAQNVPVDSSFEIAFSSAVSPDQFESAFFLKAGSANVPYTAQYQNQSSKVVISGVEMAYATEYTFGVSSGAIGRDGQMLNAATNFSFTTIEDSSMSLTPCLNASADCLKQLSFLDSNNAALTFNLYTNYDFISNDEQVFDFIEQVVVVVHGADRNADDNFRYMTNSLRDLELERKTLIISPYFQKDDDAPENGLVWNNFRWREGSNASNSNSAISSFTVMDSLMNKFSDLTKFPNLKTVFVAGHSSGAAFTQHYALANKVQNSHPTVAYEYIVANNQYFYYPDGQRFNESTQTFFVPTDCEGYDFWPYGFQFAVPYLNDVTSATLEEQQVTRNTTYFLGGNDTSTTGTLNTSDCQATLLGSNRVARGENMFTYMETFYQTTHNHRKIIVPNVAHDANGIFNSMEFKQFIMDFQ